MLRAGVVQKMTGDYMRTPNPLKASRVARCGYDGADDERSGREGFVFAGGLQVHQVVAEYLAEHLGGDLQFVAAHL